MSEIIERTVHKIQVDHLCPKCRKGFMIKTVHSIGGIEPEYEHKCDSCGFKEYLKAPFPHFKEEVELYRP